MKLKLIFSSFNLVIPRKPSTEANIIFKTYENGGIALVSVAIFILLCLIFYTLIETHWKLLQTKQSRTAQYLT